MPSKATRGRVEELHFETLCTMIVIHYPTKMPRRTLSDPKLEGIAKTLEAQGWDNANMSLEALRAILEKDKIGKCFCCDFSCNLGVSLSGALGMRYKKWWMV